MSIAPAFPAENRLNLIETASDNSNTRFVACLKRYLADRPEIKGKVAIAFEVNLKGSMINFESHEKSQPELSSMVEDAFLQMQSEGIRWIPGSADGIPHQLRVEFMLNFGVTCHARIEED